jgi:hypothetical protein
MTSPSKAEDLAYARRKREVVIVKGERIHDLRSDFDAAAMVDRGVIYRKGCVIQAYWHADAEGAPYIPPVCETWTAPSVEQARANYDDMRERWQS